MVDLWRFVMGYFGCPCHDLVLGKDGNDCLEKE